MIIMKKFIFFVDSTIILIIFGSIHCKSQEQKRRRVVPVIHVEGTHYEVGYDTGRIFSSMIKDFLATYENLRDFENQYKTDKGLKAYNDTLTNMKRRYPFYVNEIEGIADGAKVPFEKLFLLHMDDIIGTINERPKFQNDTGGCSSIGINTKDLAVLGHTEDAFSETLNHFYVVSAHIIPSQKDIELGAVEERFASMCYAGQLPGYTSGFNENGLVFSINTLSPQDLKPGNTPRTFITRALLRAESIDEAVNIFRDDGLGIGNGFSVNMIWTDEQNHRQLYNAEIAPNLKENRSVVNLYRYNNEALVHCNKYHRINLTEVMGPIIDSSTSRLEAIHAHPQPLKRADIADIISDTSGKDFRVFEDRSGAQIQTIAANIFDLQKKTWNIYINKPNASEPVAVLPIEFTKYHTKCGSKCDYRVSFENMIIN